MQENETLAPEKFDRPTFSGAIKFFPGQLPHFLVMVELLVYFSRTSFDFVRSSIFQMFNAPISKPFGSLLFFILLSSYISYTGYQ